MEPSSYVLNTDLIVADGACGGILNIVERKHRKAYHTPSFSNVAPGCSFFSFFSVFWSQDSLSQRYIRKPVIISSAALTRILGMKCGTHAGCLLIKDFAKFPFIADVLKRVNSILKFVKNHDERHLQRQEDQAPAHHALRDRFCGQRHESNADVEGKLVFSFGAELELSFSAEVIEFHDECLPVLRNFETAALICPVKPLLTCTNEQLLLSVFIIPLDLMSSFSFFLFLLNFKTLSTLPGKDTFDEHCQRRANGKVHQDDCSDDKRSHRWA